MTFCWFVLRTAKERIMGPSREKFSGGPDTEKTDIYSSDSVFEETIISEYALIINGHSLVRVLTFLIVLNRRETVVVT